MKNEEIYDLLQKFGFSQSSLHKLQIYAQSLLIYNKKYNLISKNTEEQLWERHILDCAQIVNFLDKKKTLKIADFGSGAGLPGIIMALFSDKFHVKLYEKSSVKRQFLKNMNKNLGLKMLIFDNLLTKKIDVDVIICRAFKKLPELIRISREICKKPHKMIILKGKNAQRDINKVSLPTNYRYKLENSITEIDSKIILINAK